MLQAAQDDLGQLRTQLWEAQAEVENIKAIATVSENTKQEAIDEVKRQWREEVASLQAVMKGKEGALRLLCRFPATPMPVMDHFRSVSHRILSGVCGFACSRGRQWCCERVCPLGVLEEPAPPDAG